MFKCDTCFRIRKVLSNNRPQHLPKPAVAAVVFMYALSRTHHPLLYYFIRERMRIIGVIYVYLGSLNEKTLIYGIERATLKIDRVLSDIKTTKYKMSIAWIYQPYRT